MRASAIALVIGLGLIPAGCSTDYADSSEAQYLLLVTGVNSGNPLDSDLRSSTGSVCPDYVPVRVENHSKNPNVTNTGFRGDMVIERYQVRYYRSDGRNTPGLDVPHPITGNVSHEILAEGAGTLNVEVVRRQAKVEPPLASLVGGGGGLIITMFAEITLQARMTTGQETNTATGRVQIDFADFGDDDEDCPTPN